LSEHRAIRRLSRFWIREDHRPEFRKLLKHGSNLGVCNPGEMIEESLTHLCEMSLIHVGCSMHA
jgi:hypothetical protein